MPWCAICTSDCGPFRREPLGRNNALVNVCMKCATHTVRESHSGQRGYEPTGGLLSANVARAGAKRAVGEERWAEETEAILQMQRAPTPALPTAEADIQAMRIETGRRIRTRAIDVRSRKSSRERKLLR